MDAGTLGAHSRGGKLNAVPLYFSCLAVCGLIPLSRAKESIGSHTVATGASLEGPVACGAMAIVLDSRDRCSGPMIKSEDRFTYG